MSKGQMIYRRLGQCGTKVSALSLGGWTTFGGSVVDDQLIKTILYTAFESGINFFDIADIYAKGESERAMGKVLRDFPRHELVISSKVFWPMSDDVNDRGLSRKHIMESVEKSLKRVGTDYFDLYFCHRWDPETPLEETVRAMDDLVRSGKVLHWGTSEWTGEQIRAAQTIADRRNLYAPQVEQPQYNLLARDKFERDVAPTAQSLGMGTVVWSPLASGLLTGKYNRAVPQESRLGRIEWLRSEHLTESKLEKVRAFTELAYSMQTTPTRLALAWTLRHPAVSSVILGATQIEQLLDNLASLSVTIDDKAASAIHSIFKL